MGGRSGDWSGGGKRPQPHAKHRGGASSQHGPHPPGNKGKGDRQRGGGGFTAMRSVVVAAAATAAAKQIGGIGSRSDKSSHGVAGRFDLYLLAQSWAPRFCCTNGKKCKAEGMDKKTELSVHGLWPAYTTPDRSDRTYPAFCDKGKSSAADSESSGRMKHEWSKHGTCTRLSKDGYFSEETRAATAPQLAASKRLLEGAAGSAVDRNTLLDAFGGDEMVAVMADKKCRLTEITTCWAKGPGDAVGRQVACPPHVLGSGRNSAALNHCARLFIEQTRSCSTITDEMLQMYKENEPNRR